MVKTQSTKDAFSIYVLKELYKYSGKTGDNYADDRYGSQQCNQLSISNGLVKDSQGQSLTVDELKEVLPELIKDGKIDTFSKFECQFSQGDMWFGMLTK